MDIYENYEFLEETQDLIEEFEDDLDNNEEEEPLEHSIEFYNSAKGGMQVVYDGYTYLRDKTKDTKDYFHCSNKKLGCKARIVIRNQEDGTRHIYPSNIEHTHIVRPLKSAIAVSLSELRDKSVVDGSKSCQLINDFRAEPQNLHINAMLPSTNALRQRINRSRNKNTGRLPPEPANLEFEYDRLFCTINNECIILNDWTSADGSERITVFSTERLFNYLCESNIWLCDGTFQTCPKLFYQLFIVHGNLPQDLYVAYPMIFVLLSGKSTQLYNASLDMIDQAARVRGKRLKFTHALFDFEKAIANAFTSRYPYVNYSGCLFHLDQIILNRVKANNFYRLYISNQRFHVDIACLMALAYLPPNEIILFFEDLYPTLTDEAKRIAIWFKLNYIEGNNGRQSRYSPAFWSIFKNFTEGYPTTQNWAESYHHRIHAVMDKERQPIYKFISFLKKEFISINTDVDKYLSGIPQKHRMPGYERVENAINAILNRRNLVPRCDTLKALVHVKDNLRA